MRGVGVWTAELTLLRGLRRFDALPADDIGLRRVISHFYRDDAKLSATEAREIASSWGEWKGLAGFYLIMAEILDLSF
jgi:DNA-3-methyladenine glycosylase II